MSETKSTIIYECKKCGAKGILIKNVSSINFNEVTNLPCGCPADNGKFYFLQPLS
ncbi:MAG: hypothetical protein QCH99_08575 [Candidatus Bathyarchaeota archaeon]|nr:hypothetical protein [Candidatus Bathyarchaeum tardum]WGM89928.1 MAG: hypothetical protein NUK63_02065 [Candidatus Bathyarchaeum tardum]